MNEMINFCLERMIAVRIIARRRSSEEVYDGRLMGFLYDGVCSFSYVDLYNNVDVGDWHEAVLS